MGGSTVHCTTDYGICACARRGTREVNFYVLGGAGGNWSGSVCYY